MDEYYRLYDMYIKKQNEELLEILNPNNGYTETAIEVASDILKDRNYSITNTDLYNSNHDDHIPNTVFSNIINQTKDLFNFFKKKIQRQKIPDSSTDTSLHIQYGNSTLPDAKLETSNEMEDYDLGFKYVRLSTSGDEDVCPMCAQFEGKIFLTEDAPELPLCPSCACAYIFIYREDLPANAIISNKKDFTLPADCTPMFYEHQHILYTEKDNAKIIRLCEQDLEKLYEFMTPYISAGFPAPSELICRDLLPRLYMQSGQWDKAEKAIKKCISAKAYYPEDGTEHLTYFQAYRKVATETLSYLFENPGCLQRNIYKKMGYEGEEKDLLKDFLRYSQLITKIKYNNTNQLFCNTVKTIDQI